MAVAVRAMTVKRALGALALLLVAAPASLAAQVHGQHWTVTPERDRATVGDTVTIAFRVRLDERDLLFDTVPKPARTQPDWIRIYAVEKLHRLPDRIFVGKARMAFYRPGRQQVPIFELPFMRSVKGLSRGTLSSDTATVEVVPVLGAGSSATLRDIKEPARVRGPDPLELALGVLALAAAGWLTWRARHRSSAVTPVPVSVAVSVQPAEPYAIALDLFAAIERERWSTRDVARHYAEVTDVLRDYLEAYGVPARERTTSELRWALPPGLLAGRGRRQFETVFAASDLVKFAHWRPGVADAERFLAAARELLEAWRGMRVGVGDMVRGR
ncbi:MAG: hypothetical protein ABJC36_00490 [Gemmatimonadales bacterium]